MLETSIHFIQQNQAKIIALNSPLSIFSFRLQQKLSRGQAKAPSFTNTFNRVCFLLIKCSEQLLVSPRLWEEGGITVLLFTSRVSLSSSHLIQASQRERLLSKQRVGEICLFLCLSCSYWRCKSTVTHLFTYSLTHSLTHSLIQANCLFSPLSSIPHNDLQYEEKGMPLPLLRLFPLQMSHEPPANDFFSYIL